MARITRTRDEHVCSGDVELHWSTGWSQSSIEMRPGTINAGVGTRHKRLCRPGVQSQEDPKEAWAKESKPNLATQEQLQALPALAHINYMIDVGWGHSLMGRMVRQCSCILKRCHRKGDGRTVNKNMTSKDYDSHIAQFVTNTYSETEKLDDTKLGLRWIKDVSLGKWRSPMICCCGSPQGLGERVSSYPCGRSVEFQQLSTWQRG